MNLSAVDLIGISGAILVLLAFLQNNRGKWTAETVWYDVLNAVGSGLLLIFAVLTGSIPFVITNAVWTAFSAWDLITRRVGGQKVRNR
jgi:hypothetical protein